MDVSPFILAGGSACVSFLNAWYLRRQSTILEKLESRSGISKNEIQKCIQEQDEIIEHIYVLYTLLTELDQILTSILSPVYFSKVNFVNSLHAARIFPSYDTHVQCLDVPVSRQSPLLTFYQSTNPDVIAFTNAFIQLLSWLEKKKKNRTAIHAFHRGSLHTALEDLSLFFHTTGDGRVRVSLLDQIRMGRLWCTSVHNLTLESKIGQWRGHLPPIPNTAHETIVREEIQDTHTYMYLDSSGAGRHHQMFDIIVDTTNDTEPCSTAVHYQFSADANESSGAVVYNNSGHLSNSPIRFIQLTQVPVPSSWGKGLNSKPFSSILYADYEVVHPDDLETLREKAEHSWNDTYAPLYVGIHCLFGSLQFEKERFVSLGKGSTFPEYSEVIVSAFVKACWRWQRRWSIRNAYRLNMLMVHIRNSRSPLSATVRAQFIHHVCSRTCSKLRKQGKALVHEISNIEQLLIRLTSLFVPMLFRYTIESSMSECFELQSRIRKLICETDTVIQSDIRFREALMDNETVNIHQNKEK